MRLLLLHIFVAPFPVSFFQVAAGTPGGDSMLMLIASFITQIKANGMAAFVLQKAKESETPILSWISTNTPWVTRTVAALVASATAVGLHWTYTGNTLVISGLSATAIIAAVWQIAQNYLFQHAWYKMVFDPAATGAVPAAKINDPLAVKK